MKRTADAVIVGAGITGLAIAREMAKRGASSIMIVDPNPPMTLTSAYSTECYRDVWHNPSMAALVSRSIDLMEILSDESDNAFGFRTHQHGYLFVSDVPDSGPNHHFNEFANGSTATAVRHHRDPTSDDHLLSLGSDVHNKDGIDLLWGSDVVAKSFPHVHAQSALHARRAGWIDAQQLGRYLLDDVERMGGVVKKDELVSMERDSNTGAVISVRLKSSGEDIHTSTVINAAGPFSGALSQLLLPSLPAPNFTNELHAKVIFRDQQKIVPSDSPMVILGDKTTIPWTEEENEWIDDLRMVPEEMAEAGLSKWLGSNLPSGCHVRPASSGFNVALWEYAHHDRPLNIHTGTQEEEAMNENNNSQQQLNVKCIMPTFYDEHVITKIDPLYSEMTLRALSLFIPRLSEYVGVLGGNDIFTDGGYYTYAPDRMPVLGEVSEVPGYFMACGVAGYGIMAAMGVAELICDQREGKRQRNVEYNAFDPNRLFDPTQRKKMEQKMEEEAASTEQAVGGSL